MFFKYNKFKYLIVVILFLNLSYISINQSFIFILFYIFDYIILYLILIHYIILYKFSLLKLFKKIYFLY